MSRDKKSKDYEVGYGKPPVHSRFKPGQSGNPRGPRPQFPRAEIESQIGKDLRRILRDTVVVNGEKITVQEALVRRMVGSALKGHNGNLRLALDLARGAFRDNVARKPDLQLLDGLDYDRVVRTPRLRQLWLPYLKRLAKLSREP